MTTSFSTLLLEYTSVFVIGVAVLVCLTDALITRLNYCFLSDTIFACISKKANKISRVPNLKGFLLSRQHATLHQTRPFTKTNKFVNMERGWSTINSTTVS